MKLWHYIIQTTAKDGGTFISQFDANVDFRTLNKGEQDAFKAKVVESLGIPIDLDAPCELVGFEHEADANAAMEIILAESRGAVQLNGTTLTLVTKPDGRPGNVAEFYYAAVGSDSRTPAFGGWTFRDTDGKWRNTEFRKSFDTLEEALLTVSSQAKKRGYLIRNRRPDIAEACEVAS